MPPEEKALWQFLWLETKTCPTCGMRTSRPEHCDAGECIVCGTWWAWEKRTIVQPLLIEPGKLKERLASIWGELRPKGRGRYRKKTDVASRGLLPVPWRLRRSDTSPPTKSQSDQTINGDGTAGGVPEDVLTLSGLSDHVDEGAPSQQSPRRGFLVDGFVRWIEYYKDVCWPRFLTWRMEYLQAEGIYFREREMSNYRRRPVQLTRRGIEAVQLCCDDGFSTTGSRVADWLEQVHAPCGDLNPEPGRGTLWKRVQVPCRQVDHNGNLIMHFQPESLPMEEEPLSPQLGTPAVAA
ncbi:hypothetical protein HRR83_001615 [Exophiala dermatitidis]|uniref:Uncharacterized protein n=1 Tax=Exophiala dermatitidis TaxID=5970 RepID=A0AAN6F223_EXODE|nr:hypothetical protein HRR73_004749 [Exophiala dermatitidis]KAJ4523096.1 hypothetical protein HRR75_001494 [Exophiala dermatitidis]KAJ4526422.1 hypothetical protein HRR74_001619 [Exophiala dermatitidis]KAJ4560064.1 hypothetical protein HRR78_000588 [Exophiala dermatitidis]KAJ4567385.1 hypothetical protein HRR79_004903 [Exophiala dermatitidis]